MPAPRANTRRRGLRIVRDDVFFFKANAIICKLAGWGAIGGLRGVFARQINPATR